MASRYPAQIDSSLTLPTIIDNFTPVSGAAVNRIRDAIVYIESELGVKPSGTYGTVRARLDFLESNSGGGGGGNFLAGGDLSGNSTLQVVIGLQNRAVANTTPNDGDILTWVNADTSWEPQPAPVSFVAGGDLAGTATSQQVVSLTGDLDIVTVPTASLAFGALPALTGNIRFSVDSSISGRDLANSKDLQAIRMSSVGGIIPSSVDVLYIGSDDFFTASTAFDETAIYGKNAAYFLTGNYTAAPPNTSASLTLNPIGTCRLDPWSNFWMAGNDQPVESIPTFGDGYGLLYIGNTDYPPTITQTNGVLLYSAAAGLNINASYLSVQPNIVNAVAVDGVIRLPNATTINFNNVTSSADIIGIGNDASNNIFVGGNIDGSVSAGQVFISPASFGYLRAGGSNAMLWSATNVLLATPAIGYNTQYAVHGMAEQPMVDANQTVSAGVYAFNTIQTTGAITADRQLIFPAVSDANAYTKIIDNSCTGAYSIIVRDTGDGTTVSVPNGTIEIILFHANGATKITSDTVAVADISPGTDGYIISTVAGVATWITQEPRQYEISFASGLATTTSNTFVRAGARLFNVSPYPATIGALTRTVRFVADVDKTSGATNVEVQLFDKTNAVAVTGTDLTSTSTSNAAVVSASLTVGSSSGNIRSDTPSQYELQFKMNGGGGSDAVFLTNARLLITYA